MKAPDLHWGIMVKAARVKERYSQRQLAEAMNARGHSWFQTTVGRVERGARHLTVEEASDLDAILDLLDMCLENG